MIPKPQLEINALECAKTLASRFYTDPQMLELEKEWIFSGVPGNWLERSVNRVAK